MNLKKLVLFGVFLVGLGPTWALAAGEHATTPSADDVGHPVTLEHHILVDAADPLLKAQQAYDVFMSVMWLYTKKDSNGVYQIYSQTHDTSNSQPYSNKATNNVPITTSSLDKSLPQYGRFVQVGAEACFTYFYLAPDAQANKQIHVFYSCPTASNNKEVVLTSSADTIRSYDVFRGDFAKITVGSETHTHMQVVYATATGQMHYLSFDPVAMYAGNPKASDLILDNNTDTLAQPLVFPLAYQWGTWQASAKKFVFYSSPKFLNNGRNIVFIGKKSTGVKRLGVISVRGVNEQDPTRLTRDISDLKADQIASTAQTADYTVYFALAADATHPSQVAYFNLYENRDTIDNWCSQVSLITSTASSNYTPEIQAAFTSGALDAVHVVFQKDRSDKSGRDLFYAKTNPLCETKTSLQVPDGDVVDAFVSEMRLTCSGDNRAQSFLYYLSSDDQHANTTLVSPNDLIFYKADSETTGAVTHLYDVDTIATCSCQAQTACDDGNACTSDVCEGQKITTGSGVMIANGICMHYESTCDDGNNCTLDSCDAATGACQNDPDPACAPKPVCDPNGDGSDCSDNDACTKDECKSTVGLAGMIVECVNTAIPDCPSKPECTTSADCEDNNPCTRNFCDAGKCVFNPDDTKTCDDGNACTDDVCTAGACVGTAINCNDGDRCTVDSCNPDPNGALKPGCQNVAKDCNDSDVCTVDSCDDLTGACVNQKNEVACPAPEDLCAGKNCDDGSNCTNDSCDQATGSCVNQYSFLKCPIDLCALKDCDDANPCTTDSCSAGTCSHAPIGSGQLNACGGCEELVRQPGEACATGQGPCDGSGNFVCDSNNNNKVFCDATGVADGESCAVSNPDACQVYTCKSTVQEPCKSYQCKDHSCVGSPDPAKATDPACGGKSVDKCAVDADCAAIADPNSCGIPKCVIKAFGVVPGTYKACELVAEDAKCDDGASCTADSCDPDTKKCVNTADNAKCDDGNVCTTDSCTDVDFNQVGAQYGCLQEADPAKANDPACKGPGPVCDPPDCNDNNPCTDDRCGANGCTHVPNGKVCDENPPPPPEACKTDADCPDPRGPCLTNSCQNGKCVEANTPDGTQCSDGDMCTAPDQCKAGKCQAGEAVVCAPKPEECATGVCTNEDGAGCVYTKDLNDPKCKGEPQCGEDADGDGHGNLCDNCPMIPNADQKDADNDGVGDLCDNCKIVANPDQKDSNGNTIGDLCEQVCQSCCCQGEGCPKPDCKVDPALDPDHDGWNNAIPGCDVCPWVPNVDLNDGDKDSLPDACDPCPQTAGGLQFDTDGDGLKDSCQPKAVLICNGETADKDGDTIPDKCDNCPVTFNKDQVDDDQNGAGNACQAPASVSGPVPGGSKDLPPVDSSGDEGKVPETGITKSACQAQGGDFEASTTTGTDGLTKPLFDANGELVGTCWKMSGSSCALMPEATRPHLLETVLWMAMLVAPIVWVRRKIM